MINDWVVRLAPWLLGLAALGFMLTVWAAARAFQTMRTGPYYIVRDEARKRSLRLMGLALVIVVVSVTLGLYALAAHQRPPASRPLASRTLTATAQIPTVTSSPTSKPSPTLTSTSTPLPSTATATSTPTPTRSAPADLPPTLLTPLPSAVPAVPDARFGPLTFAAGPKNARCASSPPRASQTEFTVGTPKICAYFTVHNMVRHTAWTAAWYKDGKYVAGDPLLWDGLPGGIGIAFYAEPGQQPGRWELRLFIEDRLQSTGVFTVGLPAVTPTPALTTTPTD